MLFIVIKKDYDIFAAIWCNSQYKSEKTDLDVIIKTNWPGTPGSGRERGRRGLRPPAAATNSAPTSRPGQALIIIICQDDIQM